MSIDRILLATGNSGKLAEMRELVGELPFTILSLADFPYVSEVAETGSTFAENALLKARGYAEMTGVATLADDSGLAVTALGGRPGVLSARFGGDVDFHQKMRLLLNELEAAETSDRSAQFICSMALALPNGEILCLAESACSGRLADKPSGDNGFGYDPIFIPDGFERSFGELSPDVKAAISHRRRAMDIIIRYLQDNMPVPT